jgi:glycosyltransferase involved in cell wall biosynthesis
MTTATATMTKPTQDPTPRPLAISLIIPTLNEADGLREILPRIPAYVSELIVVDGGSTDDTVAVAKELRPDALVMGQSGRGMGNAVKTGAEAASGQIIVMMDADGSMNPEDIVLFVDKLLDGADFVKGSRVLPGAGSNDFTMLREFGNNFLTRAANLVSKGRYYTDITFGFTAYWETALVDLGDLSDGFGYEMQGAVRAARGGMTVAEVPTHEPARVGGESKLNPFTDGWSILKVILAERKATRANDAFVSTRELEPALFAQAA